MPSSVRVFIFENFVADCWKCAGGGAVGVVSRLAADTPTLCFLSLKLRIAAKYNNTAIFLRTAVNNASELFPNYFQTRNVRALRTPTSSWRH